MESDRPRSQNEILAAALRLIRLHRRMKPAEVADAMGMAKRSYEHFEAGKGKINLERIHRFAEATDSDPYAIIDCMALGSPEFAVRCADNKAMLALRVVTQEFDESIDVRDRRVGEYAEPTFRQGLWGHFLIANQFRQCRHHAVRFREAGRKFFEGLQGGLRFIRIQRIV